MPGWISAFLKVYRDEYTQEGGWRMAQEALGSVPRPTAIFAANNFIAFGAYRAVCDAGLRVPDDIAIAAFDDLPASMMLDPFFTVVAQPAYEMGQTATQLLLARLSGEDATECREIVLPFEVIVRRSSGPPRGDAAAQVETRRSLTQEVAVPIQRRTGSREPA